MAKQRARINQSIRAPEVRVIGLNGENLGVMSTPEALKIASNAGVDLIEIAATAKPPVVRVMDQGKYQYQLAKEAKKIKKKSHEVEVKGIRVRLGTGTHDLILKAKKAEKFLGVGNRVQVQLTLRGREKYLDKAFIESRIKKILETITIPFKVSDGPKRGPRGLLITLEPDKHGKDKQISSKKSTSDKNRKNTEATPSPESL